MSKAVVIIPTYNEKENIGLLIDKLEEVFAKVPKKWEMNILVVDDSSPDGTGEVVRGKMDQFKNVHLFTNKEKVGLGGAYMRGMEYATQEMKADLMFEFDADFQHDPELIPSFLEKIDGGADLVLGSRYMKGGSIPKFWGIHRKILSVGGNIFTRVMMLDRKIHDWTTGFRAVRPELFFKVKDKITELKTYSFQLQFLYQARKLGANIAEVPLNFKERYKGYSKIPGLESTIKTFWFVIKVRTIDFFKSRFFKFGTVGFLGYLVNAFFLNLFSKMSFPEVVIWAASTELAIINNFALNNIWTFKNNEIKGGVNVIKKFLQFNLTSAGALIIQTVLGTLGVYILGGEYRQLLLPFIVLFVVLPYNYFMYTRVIWKKKQA
ncbi:MAG: Dolichyl-phosphate beta-D-mannosyltransferase [Candidatus Woesebacteria bacterium GW2011_GWB1_41_10]|uniref:Dolichyl-phosphate beta-D-mannosyltransferase n=1 Tax=Candidatus Woesebacteria bacterium GW2011_GWB1_41_10 TaxID=1618577 RepID=A0A0G0U5T1_9BACT|nr:MAG: Dolichyl-phosphate beta-D-mannosyltransferase [Candidatus Woesebacteria bacterium GW2011_GWB1_41_10]